MVFQASTRPTPPTSRPLRCLHDRPVRLIALRLTLANPDDHVVLPEIISKEPLGPAVRQGDDEWFNIVKWTLFAMIQPKNPASRRTISKR